MPKMNKKVHGKSCAAGVGGAQGGPVKRIPVGFTHSRKSVKK